MRWFLLLGLLWAFCPPERLALDFSRAVFPKGMPHEGGCGVSAWCRLVVDVSMDLEATNCWASSWSPWFSELGWHLRICILSSSQEMWMPLVEETHLGASVSGRNDISNLIWVRRKRRWFFSCLSNQGIYLSSILITAVKVWHNRFVWMCVYMF